MKKKLVYVTSQSPFGNGEIWAINEMTSLLDLGVDLVIVPRTGYGKFNSKNAEKLLPWTIATPFINFSIIFAILKKVITEPFDFFSIIKWIIIQSDSFVELAKGLIILPKSIYISNLLKNQGVEHVHAFSSTSIVVVAYILAHELKIPWSMTVHTSCKINESHRRSVNARIASASLVRTISNQVSDNIKIFIGSDLSKKINVVHIGVKCDNIINEEKINNEFIIVSPGGPWPFKGNDISLLAAKYLVENGINNFKWIIYGTGPLLKELLKMTSDLGLEKKFIFAGFIDNQELLTLYENRKVDLVVLNSIKRNGSQEGIPVSLMEAMSFAIPVIATDCGGTKELVDGESGVLIQQGDEEATANAIIALINSEELRIQKGRKGLAKVLIEFDSKKIAKQLKSLYLK